MDEDLINHSISEEDALIGKIDLPRRYPEVLVQDLLGTNKLFP